MKYIKTYESKESDEIEDFIDYVMDFYGANWEKSPEDYDEDPLFGKHKITRELIEEYVYDYVNKRKRIGVWGPGDSFDREIFRDLLRFKLGIAKLDQLEYNIRPYITHFEKDADKYNL